MTMKMWNKKFLAAAVVLSAMTGQVYAAETAHTGTGDDETLPTYSLGEVVVTATRTQKRDIDVPAATTVITAESMIILLVVPTQVLLLAVPTTFTPQRQSWAVSRLDCVRHHGPAMAPVARLRNGCVLLSCCPE